MMLSFPVIFIKTEKDTTRLLRKRTAVVPFIKERAIASFYSMNRIFAGRKASNHRNWIQASSFSSEMTYPHLLLFILYHRIGKLSSYFWILHKIFSESTSRFVDKSTKRLQNTVRRRAVIRNRHVIDLRDPQQGFYIGIMRHSGKRIREKDDDINPHRRHSRTDLLIAAERTAWDKPFTGSPVASLILEAVVPVPQRKWRDRTSLFLRTIR